MHFLLHSFQVKIFMFVYETMQIIPLKLRWEVPYPSSETKFPQHLQCNTWPWAGQRD